MENKVTNQHPSYAAASPFRIIFEDVCNGTAAMRAKGKAYLPQFPKEKDADWKFRNDTATLYNVTQKTVDTFCGLVFQKDITLGDDVPVEITGNEKTPGLVENIDNKGNHFNIFARDLFEDSFDGCAGVLVDSPSTQASDLGEQKAMGLRPYWVAYDACDIINWDYEVNPVSKKLELSLVVLKECLTVKSGQFVRDDKIQYRVLMLNESRSPIWEVWTETDERDADGKTKTYAISDNGTFGNQTKIPFAIVGDLSDKPPLMDLSYKNIEHYQTYSDYKSIIHKTCVPMLYTINIDGDAPDNIGGSSYWKLALGGSMGFAEVQGNSIDKTRTSLEDIKAEMATLGLQMLMANRRANADVTATEKLLDSIQETSSLQVRATQLKDAIELALGFTAQYLGKGEDKGGSISLGATWTQLSISADELNAWSNLVDLGQMSLETFLELRQEAGQLPDDVDVEDELKRIKDEAKEMAATAPVVSALKQPNGNQPPPNNAPPPPVAAA